MADRLDWLAPATAQHQGKRLDWLSGGTPLPTGPASAPVPYSGPPVSFPNDQPGTTYGNLLPFAKDEATGKFSFAAPEIIRSPMRGIESISSKLTGQKPITESLNPDELGALSLGGGSSVAAGTGEAIARAAEPRVAEAVANKIADKAVTTSDDVKAVARQLYEKADQTGGVFNPTFTNEFINEAKMVTPQSAFGKTIGGDTETTKLISRLEQLQNKPMTLADAQESDEELGHLISAQYANGRLSKDGFRMMQIQDQLRDKIEQAGPGDLVGTQNGFTYLPPARQAWSQAAKMRDIEQIKTRAEQAEQPITTIRAGIRTLLANPKRLRGYTPEEITALKNAAEPGALTQILRGLGSGLTKYITAGGEIAGGGGVTGGLVGGMAGGAISSVAKKAATNMQMKKVNKLLNQLGQTGGVPTSPMSGSTP